MVSRAIERVAHECGFSAMVQLATEALNEANYTDAENHVLADAMREHIEAWGDVDSHEFFDTLFSRMNAPTIGNCILQMPLAANPMEARTANVNKTLALEVAEVLGPDHAQTLYHFAVLVTKLA